MVFVLMADRVALEDTLDAREALDDARRGPRRLPLRALSTPPGFPDAGTVGP